MNNTKTDRNDRWREELRKTLKNRDRAAFPRVKMPELEAGYRSRSYEEVNQGLSLEQALTEAKRCLDCPDPQCVTACPVEIDIPGFIKNIERSEVLEAAAVLKRTSALPAVCGRVCPQEKQCESKCIHLKMKHESVAIGYLERFAADYAILHEQNRHSVLETESPDKTLINDSQGIADQARHSVAVIGSGPAGLSFAGDMAKFGYNVTVFEALHEIGGVLKYGIPEFRLPNKIVDFEIDNLKKLGVKFITNCIVGKTISQEDLYKQGFKGLFIA
ncbi:MAG: NAD-binding protein, partial [Candidatus Symbiothrix sp.]|nr:NAD-binding protein [Candidatus Symbiothrix sp.]